MKKISGYEDFVENLYDCGMTLAGENAEGVFSLCQYFDDTIQWHTDDENTDPWAWRMKVLRECDDIAYGKFFFKKAGYITKEFFPYFYKLRRKGSMEEAYEAGEISSSAKKIYEILCKEKELPLHLLKEYSGLVKKEDKTCFQNAMTELQMKFYISMCGSAKKQSKKGMEYGWNTTIFCLTEDFFETPVLDEATAISKEEAFQILETKIMTLNPDISKKKLEKFMLG